MYLKRLEMNGFKSFVDARIAFQPGITAIVGPNGTGKSNILDAILWVLGEQSTKTLRSERMEDVIFNGTESRKPQGMVEVSLILGDVDGGPGEASGEPAPLPYSLGECQEVMVTRRLFRDGVSEYFINQTPCRLKDLRALLLDTRAGSKGHTVIEQGMIDRLLKASPIERRELIEETAGITRFKKQKAEALRKLEATNQNLLRVRDIINEVKRQLGSLERQAKAAAAYQTLRQEIRRLELIVLTHEYHDVSKVLKECEHTLRALTDQEMSEEAVSARLQGDAEAIRFEVTDGERGYAQAREEVSKAEGRLTQAAAAIELLAQRAAFFGEQRVRVQADLEHLKKEQREDAEALVSARARAESFTAEVSAKNEVLAQHEAALADALQQSRESQAALDTGRTHVMERVMAATAIANRLANSQGRGADLGRRIERLEQERIQAEAVLEERAAQLATCIDRRRRREAQAHEAMVTLGSVSGQVADLKKQATDAEQVVGSLQEELTVGSARQTALQAVTRVQGLPDTKAERLGDTLAHVVSVPPQYDTAIEAVLGHKLMGMLVDTPQEAIGLLEHLKRQGAGGTFIPKRPRVFRRQAGPELCGPGVIGSALRVVTPKPGYEELLSHLLDGVLIVQNLERALVLWQEMDESRHPLLVTLHGEIVAPDGTIMARAADVTVGVIARERELQALSARLHTLTQTLQQAKTKRDQLAETLSLQSNVHETCEAEIRQCEMDLVGERKDEQRGEEEIAQARQRLEVLMAEREAAETERAALAAMERADREGLQRAEAERTLAESVLGDLQAAVATNQQGVERQQTALSEVRLQAASITERLEQSRAESARLEGVAAMRKTRLAELSAEVARIETGAAAALAERQQTEAGLPSMESELSDVRRRLQLVQEAQADRIAKLRTMEAEGNQVRRGLDELRRQQETVRLREREAQIRLEGYETQLHGTYAVSFEDAVTETGGSEEHDLTAVRERLIQRRGRLQELGPVNVMAIDEHRELDERLRFLSTQEADLAQSVASLKAIIVKINRTTKQLFLDTFAELQTKFDEMFRNFFEGGRAELILVEDEEGGEPGVDIVAQPPGKRLKNIAMLSGGERALTAMALIFASFLVRPTPFCVLDEIDAPLDEENTGRFIRVLQAMSAQCQFIVITHCKQTMEVADCLYGVTMEEAGVSTLVSVRLNKLLEPA